MSLPRLTNLDSGTAALLSAAMPAAQDAKLGERIGGIETDLSAVQLLQQFLVTAQLTSAAAATVVHVIPASSVPAGKKIHITGVVLCVDGGTAWTDSTATKVQLQDSSASPVVAVAYGKAGLTANAVLGMIGSNITVSAPIALGAGLTTGKGLDIVGDATFAAGSTIYATVWGYFE